MRVAARDMALSRIATRPPHAVGSAALPESPPTPLDERLQREQCAELELVPRMLPGVAWLAGSHKVFDPVHSATCERDHVVQRELAG